VHDSDKNVEPFNRDSFCKRKMVQRDIEKLQRTGAIWFSIKKRLGSRHNKHQFRIIFFILLKSYQNIYIE